MSDKLRIGWEDLDDPQPHRQSSSQDDGHESTHGKMPIPAMESGEPSIAERKKKASEYMAPQPPPLPAQAPATSYSPVATMVTIGAVLFLAWALYAKYVPSEKTCIENVRATFTRIASSALSDSDKIRHMQAIDTSDCPQDFRIAYQDFVSVLERFSQSTVGNPVLGAIEGGLRGYCGEEMGNIVADRLNEHQYWQQEFTRVRNALAQSAIRHNAQW